MKKILLFTTLVTLLLSCEKEQEAPSETAKRYNIAGRVEKGPFIKGTKITIQELDNEFIPTGNSYVTTVVNDDGFFEIRDIELISPYVSLFADGYFYNEVRGDLSSSQITLNSVADLTEQSTLNVNIITHLTRDRIFMLNNQGISLKDAREQAQLELLSIFGLQRYNTKAFNNVSITDGSDESAAQVIISSVLLNNKSEAQFTEFITELVNSFKSSGTFPEKTKEQLWNASVGLNLEYIMDRLIDRYASLNREIELPDLAYFIDWDKDGIAGNELGELGSEKILNFEIDTLFVSKEGGEFVIGINSNIPFTEGSELLTP